MTDGELDKAIVASLGVQRAEYRTGHSLHRGLTAHELALTTGKSAERVETRLRELARAGRVSEPMGESERWTVRRRV